MKWHTTKEEAPALHMEAVADTEEAVDTEDLEEEAVLIQECLSLSR
jgi:hypothetical protein